MDDSLVIDVSLPSSLTSMQTFKQTRADWPPSESTRCRWAGWVAGITALMDASCRHGTEAHACLPELDHS